MSASGLLVWLCTSQRRPARPAEPMSPFVLFLLNMARGVALMVPVSALIILAGAVASDAAATLPETVVMWLFVLVFAVPTAIVGGIVYLPVVLWAAGRWPRRGRAIALACTPLLAAGTLFLDLWRMLAAPGVCVPVALGILFYAATLRLPAASSSPRVEGGR